MRHGDFALASGFANRLFVPPPIPTITTTTVPNGQVGAAYQTGLAATGGTAPYSWSTAAGTLPAGLSIVGQTITGTPTSAGSSSFTLLVTDSLAQTDIQAISLTIGSAPPPPQPVVATSSLAQGTVGTSYQVFIQATGGTVPYAWSILSGALPAGLTLSQGSGITANLGVISGTPTTATTATVGVQVTDSQAQQATKTLTLTVVTSGPNPLPQTIPFGSAPSTTNLGTESLQPGAESPPYPINWDTQDDFVSTPFSCPSGLTQFTIRYSAAVAASRLIVLDGTTIFGNLTFPATGNFQTWNTVSFTRTLTAGNHTMTMVFDVPSGSHDFINPDNLKLTVGSTAGVVFIPPQYATSATNPGDQTANIQAWLNTIPSGTTSQRNTVSAILGHRYRIEGTLYLGSASNPTVTPKHDFNFDLNGAEFFATIPNPYGCECISTAGLLANSLLHYVGHGLDGTKAVKINGVVHTTGITNGGTYWPLVTDPNNFKLSASQGGPAITLGNTGTTYDTFEVQNAPFPQFLHAFQYNSTNPGNSNFTRGMFWAAGCTNLRFTNSAVIAGQITGAQTNGIMGTYDARYEGQAGIRITGGTNIEVDSIDTRATLGDGVQCLGGPSFLNIHDMVITGPGRHGISVGNNGATDCVIHNNWITGAPRHSVDLEDDVNPATKPIRRITASGNYFRIGNNPGPNNLNLWWAMGGESSNMGDIVVGGLLGHPTDGNLVVGGIMQDDVVNAFTRLATTRRGPYTFGYNVGGGQITIHTTVNSATATFSGLTNNLRFTNKQVLQWQAISASTLPKPCQIIDMPTATTITLSSPATVTGTATATFGAQFGNSPPAGALHFLHIDGANSFFNTIVIAPNDGAIGTAGALYDNCTGINDHDNIVIGGPDSAIINPVVSQAGGKAAVNAHIGNALNGGDAHFYPAVNASWAPINFKYDNTYIDADGSTNGANANLSGFRDLGIITVSRCPPADQLNPGGSNLIAVANGAYDGAMVNNGASIQALSNAQGGIPQWIRIVEWDGDWFGWGIGRGNGNNSVFNDGSATVTHFCAAVRRVVTKLRQGMSNPAMLKVDLCGGVGLGEGVGVGFDQLTFGLWDQVVAQIGDILDGVGCDAYSNGPTPPQPFLTNWLAAAAAKVKAYGKQFTIGEWGIATPATVAQYGGSGPFNYDVTTWTNTWTTFLKGLPASGAGSLAYWCLFDESAPFPDGRGVSHIPVDGPICKSLIESALA